MMQQKHHQHGYKIHQLRQYRQLMMHSKHHQHGYKIHQLRQCRQLMMQQKHHQPCMHEYMTQHQYIYSTTHSPTPLDIYPISPSTCIHAFTNYITIKISMYGFTTHNQHLTCSTNNKT